MSDVSDFKRNSVKILKAYCSNKSFFPQQHFEVRHLFSRLTLVTALIHCFTSTRTYMSLGHAPLLIREKYDSIHQFLASYHSQKRPVAKIKISVLQSSLSDFITHSASVKKKYRRYKNLYITLDIFLLSNENSTLYFPRRSMEQ